MTAGPAGCKAGRTHSLVCDPVAVRQAHHLIAGRDEGLIRVDVDEPTYDLTGGIELRNEIMEFHDRKLVFLSGPEGVTVELAQWLTH
jgi:hypothetical protein